MENHTDCRSEDGVTVGLIDAIISICRVLSKRSFTSSVVKEALCDLSNDEDLRAILQNINATDDKE